MDEEGLRDLLSKRMYIELQLFIYQGWLIRKDSFYDELKECACSELDVLSGLKEN